MSKLVRAEFVKQETEQPGTEGNEALNARAHAPEQREDEDLEEDPRRHPGADLALEHEREGRDGERGEGVAVDDEHVVAHAVVERHLGDDVHAGVPELQRDHRHVRLAPLHQRLAAGGIFHARHCCCCCCHGRVRFDRVCCWTDRTERLASLGTMVSVSSQQQQALLCYGGRGGRAVRLLACRPEVEWQQARRGYL